MSMRTNAFRSLMMALIVFGVALAGCSKDSKTPSAPPDNQGSVLNQDNGGLTGTDESPAFGDQDVEAEVGQEKQVEDAMSQDPVVRNLLSQQNAAMYVMTVLWGHLAADRSAVGPGDDGDLYDWTGSMSLNHGAILVRSLISFEKTDSMLPRADRESVSWISRTEHGFDGIRVVIYPNVGGTPSEDMLLTLDMPAMGFHRELSLSELQRMTEVASVDSVNQVSISAFLVPPTTNSLGFIRGRWESLDPTSNVGRYSGVWVGQQGRLSGTLRGVYGLNLADEKVIFGKFIDNSGRFAGFLRGTWDETFQASGVVKGTFTGRWLDPQNRERGTVRGTWQRPASGNGTFQGSWCVNCP